jgi:penicillin-binding protein 2
MEKARKRLMAFSLFKLLLFGILLIQLNTLAVVGGTMERARFHHYQDISQTGQRGSIYDRKRCFMAYDQKSYDLVFNRDYSKATARIAPLYGNYPGTLAVVEKNGGTTIDTFAIKRQEDLSFAFDYGNISAEAAAKREENGAAIVYPGYRQKKMTAEEIYIICATFTRYERRDYEEAAKIFPYGRRSS